MKIIVIGATGTIGKAVVEALRPRHEVVTLSRSQGDHRADITDKASVERAFAAIGEVDAIVCCAGGAVFKPLPELTDADFQKCLDDKLMGQVNVVRTGMARPPSASSMPGWKASAAPRPWSFRESCASTSSARPG
jgi:NAD(P)-dependent dehydrogenase (short-subunit alcohol dehydrogenase family)